MKKNSKNNQSNSAKAETLKTENKGVKQFLSRLGAQKITMIVVSAILAIVLVVGIVIIAIQQAQRTKDKSFDYITSDLSEYINIEESVYKNYKLSLDIAKPHDIDVDVTLLNLLAISKGATKNNALAQFSGYIDAGDIVNIYYRGYTFDEDGTEIPIETNLGNENYTSLEVGVGIKSSDGTVYSLYPGFELSLAGGADALTGQGRYFDSSNKFVKITTGTVNENQILYISYTRQLDGSTSSSDKVTASSERVVLSDGEGKIDAKYGLGFYDKITSLTVGAVNTAEFVGTIDGKKYNYKDIKIDFATDCEKEGNYILVECYIPYSNMYEDLKNKDAYYEVYVQSIVEYEEVKLTNEFIEENLEKKDFGVTAEDLSAFEGDKVSQLKQHIKKLIDDDYEELYRSELEEAMWNYYYQAIPVEKYPKTKVDSIYTEYFNDVLFQFESSGGVYTDDYGTSTTYETLEEYAVAYLALTYSDNQDWRAYLRSLAELLAKERLILYYIMRTENLMPNKEELASKKEEIISDYLEEYIEIYCQQYNENKDDYTEDEWAEFESNRLKEIHNYYNDDYFTETAYYEIALETFLTWPEVSTLDGKQQ